MSDAVWIIGTDMVKIGRYPDKDILDLASEAALGALRDAEVTMRDVDVLAVGNSGQNASGVLKQIGQTGIPAYNVASACATGAMAVRVAHMAIRSGEADIGMAIGVEKMGKAGLLGVAGRPQSDKVVFEPSGRKGAVMPTEGILGTGLMPGVFAQAGMAYASQNEGVGFEQFARIAEKNHAHSALNPLAQYQRRFTLDEVMAAEMIAYPNTILMCSPTGDSGAAAILVSDAKLATLDPDVRRRAVKISASVLTTDPWTPEGNELPDVNTLTRQAADQAYETAGVGPGDLDLVELHDCFSTAELIHYDNLRLCEPGGAGAFIDSGAPWRDGTTPVNVSGGLVSKGHPISATGIINIFEVVTHLRGEAGERQIDGAQVGMTHVIGLGNSCGIHILEKRAA